MFGKSVTKRNMCYCETIKCFFAYHIV